MVPSRNLSATIWRRGRGVIRWSFVYVIHGHRDWFSTPGWYKFARKYVYRLTFDHDYPARPLWLGRKEEGKEWVNTEGLYEPLAVHHGRIVVGNRRAVQPNGRRGKWRQSKSRTVLASEMRNV